MSPDIWIVLIARTSPAAKSRLSPLLSPKQRSLLALAMLEDVLDACLGATEQIVSVVEGEPGIRLCGSRGLLLVPDPGIDANAASLAGIRVAATAGARSVCVIPGDLPLLRTAEVEHLAPKGDGLLVVARDRHRTGSNGLGLRPPEIIEPAFGAGSAERHSRLVSEAGGEVGYLDLPGFAWDIDTPDDLSDAPQTAMGRRTAEVIKALAIGSKSILREARPGS